jgi:DNA repair photolyase
MMEITQTHAKSILSPAAGYIDAYDFTMSQSRGCANGCRFCYVPTLHFHRKLAGSWGENVAVKSNAMALLRHAGENGRLSGARIFWSPSTDPYQPYERGLDPSMRHAHQLLEVFCEFPPDLLVIQTRAPWVIDDLDLLRQLGIHVVVAISIPTNRDDVRKLFEPRCAPIQRRVDALGALHAAGIRTQASLAPLLPCDPDELAALVIPKSNWIVAQALKMSGGARTWSPALEILKADNLEGWLQGGGDVKSALGRLREVCGPLYHEGREGFSFPVTSASRS